MSKINYTTELKKNVDSLITRAETTLGKGADHVQIAAVAVLYHAMQHNDYSRAAKMVEMVHAKIGAGQALSKWFVKFGGLTLSEDQKSFTGWKGAEYIKENVSVAKSTMWITFKAPNPYKGFDLDAAIESLITKAMNELSKAAKDADKAKLIHVDVAKIRVLKDLVQAA